jgi:predicted enzyme related to lactoylglutathione lyase
MPDGERLLLVAACLQSYAVCRSPGGQAGLMPPLLLYVDAVTIPVPDLDAGMGFYCGALGHELIWRNDATGQAGLRTPDSATEVVLTTRQEYEPDWKVASADAAAEVFRSNGGRVVVAPMDIPIGRLAVVEDPFGNQLVVLDSTKGTYDTDDTGTVIGVS